MNAVPGTRLPDSFVLIICSVAAVVMGALTLGAADPSSRLTSKAILFVILLGIAPYALTIALTCVARLRRFMVPTARAVALIYSLSDNLLRYLALYHPTGSTDSVVVVVLPFWWIPCLAVVAGCVGAGLAVSNWRSRSRLAH
jgi:hypothetical protein